ncbi:MAG: bacteriocin-protection protein YdeI/OmpD-associated family, partial [Verrucomicrobiales bacterium]|nr:bacteriocin-protection protein YdeI/OmpD-associated family [Verrucomicrobiales bacterium]
PRQAAPPEDFLAALARNKKAKLFFQTLNKANVYAIVYRLQTAKKPETRARRMNMIVEMLERGEKFHP